MKYLIALLFCFTLAAQQTVNNFTVKTNLTVAGTSPSLTVNTVSDLIGLNADSDRTVNVLGRVSVGDGGGGLFDRVLTSSGTTNTGTFFRSTQNPTYSWSRVADAGPVSAIWFGATPNDATDDTTAIQNWLNYCDSSKRNGKLPSGNYRISSSVTLGTFGNFDSATIFGDGETSIITQYGSNIPALTLVGSWSLKDLRFQSSSLQPSTSTNSVGILLYKTHMGVIDGVVVHGFAYGLRKKIENGNYVFSEVIQNCRIEAFSLWGITITTEGSSGGDSGSVLINNYINTLDPEYSGTKNNAEGGIKLQSIGEVTLIQQNVEWSNLSDSCFKFLDCESATVISPHVEGVNFIGTNAVSVFHNFQSKINVLSGAVAYNSVTSTVPSLGIFYGFGSGSTIVSGFVERSTTNSGAISTYRFQLPNAGHVASNRGSSYGITSDLVNLPSGFAPNYVLDYDKQVSSFSWTTNSIIASTNLTVNGSATVGSTLTVNGNASVATNLVSGSSVQVGTYGSLGDVSINKFVAENNIGLGSYLDSSKTFKVINNNGFFSIDGTGANSLDITFKNKSSIDRIKIKSNGQMRFIPLASDPSGAEAGDVYYNSTSNKLKCYNGTTWNDLF